MTTPVRFLVSGMLLMVFAGCYTQIRPPASGPPQASPPVESDTPALFSPADETPLYHPLSPRIYDPWDDMFYDPYRNRWRWAWGFRSSYDPFWDHGLWVLVHDPGWRWSAGTVYVSLPRYREYVPVTSKTDSARYILPRPRVRQAGFDSPALSAAEIRSRETARAQTSVRGSDSSQTNSQPQQRSKEADKKEKDKEEKREEKRSTQKRRGGMR